MDGWTDGQTGVCEQASSADAGSSTNFQFNGKPYLFLVFIVFLFIFYFHSLTIFVENKKKKESIIGTLTLRQLSRAVDATGKSFNSVYSSEHVVVFNGQAAAKNSHKRKNS